MKFSALLKSYREVNRLSYRDCSKVIGLSIATLHRIEQGKPVDQATLLLLINWMFGGQNNKVSPNTSTNNQSDAITLWREALLSWTHCDLGAFIGKNISRINAVIA